MHKHKTKTETTRAYTGAAIGAAYTARGENRKAHGGATHVERCACGAWREVNGNGGHKEYGTWQRSEVE